MKQGFSPARYFMPKAKLDADLSAALRSCVEGNLSTVVVSLFAVLLAYSILGYSKFLFLTLGSAVWIIVSLFVVKAGRVNLGRYLLFIGLTIMYTLAYPLLGQRSFFWTCHLVAPSLDLFWTTAKEQRLRQHSRIFSLIGLVISLIFYFKPPYPSEVPDNWQWLVEIIGMLLVIYTAGMLLQGVLRYQAETEEYKNRLEQQSIAILQQAKMSTLGEMAAGVAHEVNNPLGIITGKIDQLRSRMTAGEVPKEKVISDLTKISAVVVRIAKIVSGLRAFARDTGGDPFQATEISEIIEQTLNFCGETLNTNQIKISVLGDQSVKIDCRPQQISQVLLNLISNSADAVATLSEKWIEIKLESSDQGLKILITDSGLGIPKEIHEKVMQPFFTTKEIGKGTGMGLSIAKGLIENHRGTLKIKSDSPHTCFEISIPWKQSTEASAAPAA